MGTWLFRGIAVLLLAVTAVGVWHFGREFTHDLDHEHDTASALTVPADDLAQLIGQAKAGDDRVSLHLMNTTIWHFTYISLSLETADEGEPLSLDVTQNFRANPWAPGAVNEREVFLAAGWNGRPVRYKVTAAEGFQ
jgi:hypothetical protein